MTIGEKERAFLIELEKLTRETGIKVEGCGCCGSPYLERVSSEKSREVLEAGYGFGDFGKICWIEPACKRIWEEYKHIIIK